MTESATTGIHQNIAHLRQAGADQFDPIGIHYIDVLARRASSQQGRLKRLLEGKVAQAVLVLRDRLEQAQAAAALPPERPAGDSGAVRPGPAVVTNAVPGPSLGQLARELTQARSRAVDQRARIDVSQSSPENTTQYFRNTWSRLSVDKRVTQAFEQAPKNAGPMNSHRLVLRSLALMREISPDYLTRFTAYVDSLLFLDQTEKPAKAKKTPDVEAGKKSGGRSGRAQARSFPKSL